MDVPPEEEWAERLRRLPVEQQERIGSPAFLEYLRMILGQRYLQRMALKNRQVRPGE